MDIDSMASFASSMGTDILQPGNDTILTYPQWRKLLSQPSGDSFIKGLKEVMETKYKSFLNPKRYKSKEAKILRLPIPFLSHLTSIDTAVSILQHEAIFTPPELALRNINTRFLDDLPSYLTGNVSREGNDNDSAIQYPGLIIPRRCSTTTYLLPKSNFTYLCHC